MEAEAEEKEDEEQEEGEEEDEEEEEEEEEEVQHEKETGTSDFRKILTNMEEEGLTCCRLYGLLIDQMHEHGRGTFRMQVGREGGREGGRTRGRRYAPP